MSIKDDEKFRVLLDRARDAYSDYMRRAILHETDQKILNELIDYIDENYERKLVAIKNHTDDGQCIGEFLKVIKDDTANPNLTESDISVILNN